MRRRARILFDPEVTSVTALREGPSPESCGRGEDEVEDERARTITRGRKDEIEAKDAGTRSRPRARGWSARARTLGQKRRQGRRI
jgi:hypothetical protein